MGLEVEVSFGIWDLGCRVYASENPIQGFVFLVFEDGLGGSGLIVYRAACGVNLPFDSRLVSSSAAMSNKAECSRRWYQTVKYLFDYFRGGASFDHFP